MHTLSGSTWAGAALIALAIAVSCGPSVNVEPHTGGAGGSGGGAETSSTGTLDAGTGGACLGHIYYAGKFDGAPSAWGMLPGAMGMIGLEAGNNQCAALGVGADHVCDYEEVLLAEAQGELMQIPQGTTAWVQRTTVALVNGQPSAPGKGGNCNDWTYAGGHLANGEYMTFDQPGVPTFHLDDDTVFDPTMLDEAHTNFADLHCGGALHSILCCYPACQ